MSNEAQAHDGPMAPFPAAERYLGAREGRLMLVTVTAMAALVLSFVGFVRAEPASSAGPTIDPALATMGNAVYTDAAVAKCSSCHGAKGGGGVGPALSGGAVVETFPDPLDQVRWIILGSAGGADLYTAAGKTSKGGMPAFGEMLSLTQIVHVVLYERASLGGHPVSADAAAWQALPGLLEEYPDAGYTQAEVEAILAEIGPPPSAEEVGGEAENEVGEGTPTSAAG